MESELLDAIEKKGIKKVISNGMYKEAFQEWKKFPVSALPDVLSNFIHSAAKALQVDPSMVALPVLCACGGVIGTTRRIVLKDSWKAFPIIWGAIVASSGTRKSPSLNYAFDPISKIEVRLAMENEYDLEIFEGAKCKGEFVSEPKPKRIKVSDTTVESLAPIINCNPRGITLLRDELSGWFNSFNQYKGGKGGDSAAWIEMFEGREVTIDRKSGTPKTIYCKKAAISVCGGIQPSILAKCISGTNTESGLASRIVFVKPPTKQKVWDEEIIPPDIQRDYAEIISRLYEIQFDSNDEGNSIPRNLCLTPEAKIEWKVFYNEHAKEQHRLSAESLKAAFSKLENYAPKFGLICELVKNPESTQISGDSMKSGIELANWFKWQAQAIYSELQGLKNEDNEKQLLGYIKKQDIVTAREIRQGVRAFRDNPDLLEPMLNKLVNAGKLEVQSVNEGTGNETRKYCISAVDRRRVDTLMF